jgi:hypothetical protein
MTKLGSWRSRPGADWCAVSSDSMSPKVAQRGQKHEASSAGGLKSGAHIARVLSNHLPHNSNG